MWKVPLSDIDLGEEEVAAVDRVLRSKWLSMGPVTEEFEEAFAAHVGARHAFAVANGTVALHLAYAALGLQAGDEVILPSLTFVATANAALYTGARPVFADIVGLDDLTVSPQAIKDKLTPHTRAICVMHYGGYPCAMDRIMEIAAQHGLGVVEDAAHAVGSEVDGKKCGVIGDVGCFSFFANKNLVLGEGGMVVTNRDDLAEKIRLMRSHGMTTLTWDRHRGHAHSYDVVELGYNYRLDEVRAAIGLVQLKKLAHGNECRRQRTAQYRRALQPVAGARVPFISHPGQSACHLMPILLEEGIDRARFIDQMKARGIQTSIHYPPIHTFTYYREKLGASQEGLELTDAVGRREVTLPLYSTMSEETAGWVTDAVAQALAS